MQRGDSDGERRTQQEGTGEARQTEQPDKVASAGLPPGVLRSDILTALNLAFDGADRADEELSELEQLLPQGAVRDLVAAYQSDAMGLKDSLGELRETVWKWPSPQEGP